MRDTGIVIVTHNSRRNIGPCLDAAIPTGAAIVVVDNASTDGTQSEVSCRSEVLLVSNDTNLGFAAAVNQGFRLLDQQFVLLLNPDVEILDGFSSLRDACEIPNSAGAGGRLFDASGKPQAGFMVRALPTPIALILEVLLLNRLWPGNPVNRHFRQYGLDLQRRAPVEQPAGAFLMLRRSVWQELGGFDEGFYPLWFEDVDFCRRAVDQGYELYYVPEATGRHEGAHSISQLSVEKRRIYWYRSLLRYSAKHFGPLRFRLICLAVVGGALLRGLGEAVWRKSAEPLAVYAKVAQHASRCFLFGWGDRAVSSGSR